MGSEYSDSYGSSFDEYAIWVGDQVQDMFDSIPWTLPDVGEYSAEEMAALNYGTAYAEHFAEEERKKKTGSSRYAQSGAKDRLNIGRRGRG